MGVIRIELLTTKMIHVEIINVIPSLRQIYLIKGKVS